MKHSLPLIIMFFLVAKAQELQFENPILRGSYPDPSICRVEDDFFIVNSSFEYFPGLPIHHSRDLVNWELVGHGLHRNDQCTGKMNLKDVQSNGGIHAPSLRYHDGTFHIITTNVYDPGNGMPTEMINFIITADDVRGPWSDPIIIEGAPGIDPDIIFDDGRIWYVGTHAPEDPNFNGEGEIWLQELSPQNFSLIGERFFLWRGAMYYGTWAEGPHIYKKNGNYYLMIAEGGTGLNHSVMIAISDDIRGPYFPNDRNPILTSRHLSYDHWVNSTGHGDLIELKDGRWYMVALGIRSEIQTYSNMGRETHLIPVKWEKEPFDWKHDNILSQWSDLPDQERIEKLRNVNHEWPVCSPMTGRLERSYPLPFPNLPQISNKIFKDDFENAVLDLEWNFRRVPNEDTYEIDPDDGYLRLFSSQNVIGERNNCSLLGIRQKETDFEFLVKMVFETNEAGVQSGIGLLQKDDNYITYTMERQKGKYLLKLHYKEQDNEKIVIKDKILESYEDSIIFKITSSNESYKFYYSLNGMNQFNFLIEMDSDKILSKGYTGAYCGLYSTTNGKEIQEHADFDWVILK
jgi:alpha-N-arabinofuranosidase